MSLRQRTSAFWGSPNFSKDIVRTSTSALPATGLVPEPWAAPLQPRGYSGCIVQARLRAWQLIAADFTKGGIAYAMEERERFSLRSTKGPRRGMTRAPRMRCSLALVACLLAGCSITPARQPTRTNEFRAAQLMVPVAGVSPDQVPDTFRAPRGGARIHRAVDIPAPRGTPVLSADDGRVLRLHRSRKGGLTIYATDRSEHFVYYYAHLDAYRRGLAKGAHLARGQVIGFVGTTGNAHRREPHLHFQVLVRPKDGRPWGGEAIDPRPFFTRAGRASRKATALASDAVHPG